MLLGTSGAWEEVSQTWQESVSLACVCCQVFMSGAHLHTRCPVHPDSSPPSGSSSAVWFLRVPARTSQPASALWICGVCLFTQPIFFLPLVPVCLPVFSFAVFPSLLLSLIPSPQPPSPSLICSQALFLSCTHMHMHTHTRGHMLDQIFRRVSPAHVC